jgi:oxygen-independent coproporphyrinogen-3 oxidase
MSADNATIQRYVAALQREITCYGQKYERQYQKKQEIETVYFGGGTPSVIGADNLIVLLQKIKERFSVKTDVEITVEINPATIDKSGLQKLKEHGVNRLSIGLQSTDDAKLKLLGRVHTYDDFLRVYQTARETGFKNLNVDLISSLPGQTVSEYLQNLQQVIALQPEHISSYSLILEEGTPFYETYAKHPELLPNEEEDREMYHLTKTKLREAGYERYEISNYAKPGFASKHNSGYWKRVPYLGMGLGASSFYDHIRTRNISDLNEYLQIWSDIGKTEDVGKPEKTVKSDEAEEVKKIIEETEELTLQDEMAEYMYLGLRMSEGVSVLAFETYFGQSMLQVYGDVLAVLKAQKLLEEDQTNERICLTDFGMDVSNYVFEKFLL